MSPRSARRRRRCWRDCRTARTILSVKPAARSRYRATLRITRGRHDGVSIVPTGLDDGARAMRVDPEPDAQSLVAASRDRLFMRTGMGCVQEVQPPFRWQESATALTPRAPSSRRFPGDGLERRLCRQPGLEAPLALFLDRIDPVMGFGLELTARPACPKQREFAPHAAAPVAKAPVAKAPDGCTGRYKPSTSASLWGRSAGLGARIRTTVSMGPRPLSPFLPT
jgi:hypothetical protein